MLRLLSVCGLLTIALSFEFGGNEAAYASQLREQGFSEEDIDMFLQEYRDAREEGDQEEEEKVPWPVAKGYHECEEFKKHIFGKRNCTGCLKPATLSDICAEYECPPIGPLDLGCGFEARRVLSAKWAVTPIDMSDLEKGYTEAFWRLFKYINKANNQGVRIAKVAYMINRWFKDDNSQFSSGQMAFYIPSAFQASPPTPTDDQVTVETWDDVITYGRVFGGDRTDDPRPPYINKQFRHLRRALRKANITWYRMMKITFEYIRPGCGSQRNEVMLVDNESM